MKLRRVLFLLLSILLAGFFLVLLIHLGKVNLGATVEMLRRVSPVDFVELVLLNAVLIGISTVRWRSIDAVLRHASDAVPSRMTAFFVTSTGMALGLILPVQIGMTTARTIGTRAYGRTLKRGTAGTVFEQSFDLVVVATLAGASAVTWLVHGGGWTWLGCAVPLIALALLAVNPSVRLARSVARRVPDLTSRSCPRWLPERPYQWLQRALSGLSNLQHSGLLNVRLARRLLILSVARFCVVVLMGAQTARAVAARIPLWHMAAMVPFGTTANLLGITPGGIGVNELTAAAVLSMFGTPLTIASQWALANRVLVTLSCCAVVAVALALLNFGKIISFLGRDTAEGARKERNI
jgi:uncharacterized protein (TIRG00374 family)